MGNGEQWWGMEAAHASGKVEMEKPTTNVEPQTPLLAAYSQRVIYYKWLI